MEAAEEELARDAVVGDLEFAELAQAGVCQPRVSAAPVLANRAAARRALSAASRSTMRRFENTIAPLDGPPLHIHANEDEAFYVLEGQLRFLLDGESHGAPSGSFVFLPRGTPHCFQNIGDRPARMLVLFTPSGMEHFFDRFAAQTSGAEAFQTIGAPLGMDVVGPSLGRE